MDIYQEQNLVLSALLCASDEGNLGGLEELASMSKLDPNMTNQLGESALHVASGAGHLEVVKFLLGKGADIGIVDKHGDSPLYWAARQGHTEVVDFLVQEGVPIELQNKCYETCLHVAVRYGHLEVAGYLCGAGNSVNVRDEHGETPVHIGAWHGYLQILQVLCAMNPDVNIRNKDEETALHCAAARGHSECVQTLVASGADLNVQDKAGQSSLQLAIRRHHVDIALVLLHAGASLDLEDKSGETALHVAAKEGLLTIVQALCALGCKIDVQSKNCQTPLHLAAKEGHIEIVRVLCLAGCNIDVRNKEGMTAEALATSNGFTEMADLLVKLKNEQQKDLYVEQLCPGAQPLRRIKLKVFGDSGVGKTLLLSTLRTSFIGSFFRRRSEGSFCKDEPGIVTNGRPSSHKNNVEAPFNPTYTRGVDVQHVNISGAGEFSTWDFSGYEPYHQVYDHFVGNTDCIHVVLFRLTDPQELQYRQVLYWMNFLKARVMPGDIGHAGCSSKPGHVILIGTHADAVSPPLPKSPETGDFQSSEAEALLETIKIRFGSDFYIHERLMLLDTHQSNSNGLKALKLYLQGTKSIIVDNLTKTTGFLEATISYLVQLRKNHATFPVVSWPAFIEMVRANVNPLAGEVHCRQLIQQLQLMGEVIYLKGDVQDFDYVILSPYWLCHDLIGTLLSHEFLQTCRVTGTYTADDLQLLLFPDVPDILDVFQVLDALSLCTQCENEGDVEYEFPSFIFIESPHGVWEKDRGDFIYGGLRLQAPHGQDHMLGNMMTRFQVQLRRSMQEFQDPIDADLGQWRNCSKLCSGSMEGLISLHRGDQAFEVKVRGPADTRASCFYFLEDLINIAEQTVLEIAPGLTLERHFLSPRDIRSHAINPVVYPPESVMHMQIQHRTTVRNPKSETGDGESFLEVVCFGTKDVALNLTLGIDLPVSQLPLYARRELAALLDPPDSLGRDWSILGATLGLTEELPEVDSTGPQLSKTDQILVEWSLKNPNATIGVLCEKLRELGRADALDILYKSVPLYLIATGDSEEPLELSHSNGNDSGVVSSSGSAEGPHLHGRF